MIVCLGLLTLDHVMTVDAVPSANEKAVASTAELVFGGPAANAAATAAVLGSPVRLVTAVGSGPLTEAAVGGLRALGVEVVDLLAARDGAPAVSTVLVTRRTGDRAVVSVNAAGVRPSGFPASGLDDCDLLLVDGHHMPIAVEAASEARRRGVPVLLDGGSWKDGTERLLRHVDVAVVSDDFSVPDGGDVLDALEAAGCRAVARTAGAAPIDARIDGRRFRVDVETVDVVDTLGAGDVLHGALAHHLARAGAGVEDLEPALRGAAAVASLSVRHAGAHGWFPAVDHSEGGRRS